MNPVSVHQQNTAYSDAFYVGQVDGSQRSSEIILPMVFGWLSPASVVDIGCGVGPWAATARKLGASVVRGVDGDYVDRSLLKIPSESFRAIDLTQPFSLDRKFDLAICMEVAEHLDARCAATFVQSVAVTAPAVLFSAAIPGQGGTDHRNEQWPSYWAAHFAAVGFDCYDPIRHQVWDDERVEAWYRQNTLLFLAKSHPASRLPDIAGRGRDRPMDIIHPRIFEAALARRDRLCARAMRPGVRVAGKRLLEAIRRYGRAR